MSALSPAAQAVLDAMRRSYDHEQAGGFALPAYAEEFEDEFA